MDNIKNSNLKYEIKKKQFIDGFKNQLNCLDVDSNLMEVIILLVRASEDVFYKNGKKLGPIKKEAVVETLKTLIKRNFDEKQISNMIETVLLTMDIKRTPFYIRYFRIVKNYLFRSS